MAIDQILEGLDLTGAHTFLALYGCFVCVYVMQLVVHEGEDRDDPWIVKNGRRFWLMMLALGFLWSISYAQGHKWQPWPPELVILIAIDMLLTVRVLAIWARIKRSGHREWAPRIVGAKETRRIG